MQVDEEAGAGKERFKRFLKIFGDIAATSKAQADMAAALLESLNHPKDGLVAAIDDLREEVQGLREDLRRLAGAGGWDVALARLFAGGRRGR